MYKFVILIIIFLISIIYVNTQIAPTLYDGNGHYYEVIKETVDGIVATTTCSSKTYNGLKGYLATFTSEDEWNWATSKGIVNAGAWMSGSDAVKTGVWTWSDGAPEGKQPMYNLYFDKCYTFCLFGGVEPNLIVNEHWVHTSGSGGVAYWNNNNYIAVIGNYICEYGGLEEPFIPAVPTQGSTVTVSNLGKYDISKLKITFTTRDTTPETSFIISTFTKINSTHATCSFPSGQGKYTFVVSDGTTTSPKQLWHYELPYVGGAYTSFTQGGVVTISGANFGTDASKISVVLGGTPSVSCGSIKLTINHEALTCVLAATITERFLPITITVSNSKFVSYKAAVYYPSNLKYYSGFVSSSTFDLSMNNYSAQLRVDGQIGHIGVFDSQALAEFMARSLPIPVTGTAWMLWQNVYYDPSVAQFKYLTGPNQNKVCPLYYKNIPDKSAWTTATRFVINTTDFAISAFAGSASTFTEFGGYAPTFTIPNKVHNISPAGGVIDLQIDNYGTVFSVISVTFRGNSLTFTRDYINGILKVNIPPGFGGKYDISVVVDNIATPAGTQSVDYLAPVISGITRVPTSGGLVTISGSYFSNSITNTILTFGTITCSGLTILSPYNSMTCTLPSSSGFQSVTLQVDAKTSSVYNYAYLNPTITKANNVPEIGGVITVEGTNFGTVASNIVVTLGSIKCTGVTIITQHTKFTCTVPASTPSTLNLLVTVNNLPSSSYSMYYFSSNRVLSQEGSNILIAGTDLPNASSLSILIGSIDVSTFCVGSGSLITCSNLPTTVVSGTLSMFKGEDVYPTISLVLNPYISSISKTMLDTVASTTITLTGRFFESSTNGITNTIVVNQNGVAITPSSSYKFINSQTMEVYINGGFGKDYSLAIQVGSRVSNSVSYSFYAPELLSVTQVGSIVTVVGRNFSSTGTVLTYGVYQPTLTSANSNTITFSLTSVSRNGQVYVVVSQQQSNSITLNLQPSLNQLILPKPNVNGPTDITINGEYLYKSDAQGNALSLDFYYQFTTVQNTPAQKLTCNEATTNKFICSMVSGYGFFNIYAISNGLLTSNIVSNLQYVSPVVSDSSSIYYGEPNTVTINVTNFAVQYTSVSIGGGSCGDVKKLSDTSLSCFFKADVAIPKGESHLNVSVVSAGLTGFNENSFTYSPLYSCPNDCSGHGICNPKTGICACDLNWNLTDCSNDMTLIDCPNNCIDQTHGTCDRKTGLCHCTPDFQGIDCSNRTCPNDCISSINGKCDVLTGLCQCTPQFEGIDCSNRTCPNQCTSSNNGQCDVKTGLCHCTPEFQGVDCSNRTCPNDCISSLNGQCNVQTGLCQCTPQFEGIDCSNRTCPNQCTSSNNGQCDVLTGLCHCTPDFQGIDCSNRTCPNDCTSPNNGQCDVLTGLCQCTPEFQGFDCSNRTCPNDCTSSNNGQCDVLTGLCSCTPEFEGIDCSNRTCPNDCTSPNNGQCDVQTGLCQCTPQFEGADCSNRTCPNQCTSPNNGQCDVLTGQCNCLVGFEGFDCSNKTCPNNCSNQGTCDKSNGKCFCFSGWGSEDCSIATTKNPSLPPPIIDENGGTLFPGTNVNLSVAITHLRERDINNQQVKVLRMKDIDWVERSSISSNYFYYKGVWKNDPAVFELVIKYFEQNDTIEFAGEKLHMPENSVKYQITLSNFNFSSPLSSLQTIYHSKTGQSITYKCGEVLTTSTVGTNDYQIETGESTFDAKFASRAIVDGSRIVDAPISALDSDDALYNDITTSPDTDYSLLTAINSPMFNEKIELDPLFSSLFKTTEQTECSSTEKWRIPVIVVCSSVGGLSVAAASFFTIKHKLASKKIKDSISMSRRG